MKKVKISRITMLFLLILCILSSLFAMCRKTYIEEKQAEIRNGVIKLIEKNENVKKEIFSDGAIGMIVIPSIEVEAPIYEGTTKEVLKYSVGHFKNTSLWNRKCCTCIA